MTTRDEFLAQWPEPDRPEVDPVAAKRDYYYQRFAPETAERHWRRWLEQRDAIDRDFAEKNPEWRKPLTPLPGRQ